MPRHARTDPFGPSIERLIAASERRGTAPFARVRFPEALDPAASVLPEAFVSLRSHPVYALLDGEQRRRLGLLETVNFFSLNIHGEQALVAGLAERLYRNRWPGESARLSRYLQHFIHDENSHTYMLAEYCSRYGDGVMPEHVYAFESPALSRRGLDLLFFGRVYVLETFLDHVNRGVMRDPAVDPTTRAVHRSHHVDESLHIAFDRVILSSLARTLDDEGLAAEKATVGILLRGYAEYAFARLLNPRVYRALGLPEPLRLVDEVRASAAWRAFKAGIMDRQFADLNKLGVVPP